MIDTLERIYWNKKQGEKVEDYKKRIKLQMQQLSNMVASIGDCFLIKFSPNDIRPIFENQINPSELRKEIRTPANTEYLCPLCQPYDKWSGLADIDNNRRYLTKIVRPQYEGGCIDEDGVWIKCVCIMRAKQRERLKIIRNK